MVVFNARFFTIVFNILKNFKGHSNFFSVDLLTQVSIWLLMSLEFCTRIINKKGGVQVQ